MLLASCRLHFANETTFLRTKQPVILSETRRVVIVLNSIHEPSDAALVAERIVRSIAAEFHIQDRTLKVSCSLGISVFPEHREDPETLMKNADAAMYGAKENGRNQSRFFTDEMNAPVVEHSTLDTICGRFSHEKNR
jgi:predicted signal transduction protein with EAL and GGDEF domain